MCFGYVNFSMLNSLTLNHTLKHGGPSDSVFPSVVGLQAAQLPCDSVSPSKASAGSSEDRSRLVALIS